MIPYAYLVDDDEAIRDSLAWLLESRGVACQGFGSAEEFLAVWNSSLIGCLLLDIRMDGMSGPELFDILNERGNKLPVIFLTGHGDVPMAVSALKRGAFDFVEKPCNDNELANRVIEALKLNENQRVTASGANSLKTLIDTLTTREKQVMERILAGKLNKVIAEELLISMRTVEVHRANLFDKMGVRTAVELAQLLAGKSVK
ncbi:MAG TPA: response regulator [Accumulibacter sp.]|mgnify:CR=1 FL=1|nr:response regulator [Accumulibacter sp.]HMW17199.1 response regulator [Accumulibacter sp.]HMX21789.1 response regulator [Accumulibacter sp.]HMY05543.1 response regulator [Accumulibacter sp.]HNC18483.1 response regulator [Accumulibacter sp.]